MTLAGVEVIEENGGRARRAASCRITRLVTYDLSELPQLLTDLYRVVDRLQEIAPGRKFTPDGHLVGSIGEAVAAYAYGMSVKQANAFCTGLGRQMEMVSSQNQGVMLVTNTQNTFVFKCLATRVAP